MAKKPRSRAKRVNEFAGAKKKNYHRTVIARQAAAHAKSDRAHAQPLSVAAASAQRKPKKRVMGENQHKAKREHGPLTQTDRRGKEYVDRPVAVVYPIKNVVSLYDDEGTRHVARFLQRWRITAEERDIVSGLAALCVDVLRSCLTKAAGKDAPHVFVTGSHALGTQLIGHLCVDIVVSCSDWSTDHPMKCLDAFHNQNFGLDWVGGVYGNSMAMVVVKGEATAQIVFTANPSAIASADVNDAHQPTLSKALHSVSHLLWFRRLPAPQQALLADCVTVIKAMIFTQSQQEEALRTTDRARVSPHLKLMSSAHWLFLAYQATLHCSSTPTAPLAWAVRGVLEILSRMCLFQSGATFNFPDALLVDPKLSRCTKTAITGWAQGKLRLVALGLWDRALPLDHLGAGVTSRLPPLFNGPRQLVEAGFRFRPLHV